MFELTLKMTIPNGDAAADFFPALGLAMQQLRGVGATVDADESGITEVAEPAPAVENKPAAEKSAEKKPRKARETKKEAAPVEAQPEASNFDDMDDDALIAELRKLGNLIVKNKGGETVRNLLADRGAGKYSELDTEGKRELAEAMVAELDAE